MSKQIFITAEDSFEIQKIDIIRNFKFKARTVFRVFLPLSNWQLETLNRSENILAVIKDIL